MNPMAQVSNAATVFLPRSEFDAFLFAQIGEETNGMTLSVLSMLARAGVDPWWQAAELARLPGGVAIETLVSLIAALPAGADQHRDDGTLARRLISLLPRREGGIASQRNVQEHNDISAQAIATALIIVALLLLGAGWASANWQTPAHAAAEAHVPGSGTITQQKTP
jgi:hypothetical protein